MRFAGYAAVFDRPDRGGDIVRRGAFARALQRAGEVPLLWQHKAGAVVGWLVRIALAALLIGIAVRLRLTDLIAS